MLYRVGNWHYKCNNLKATQGTYPQLTKSSVFVFLWRLPQSTKQNWEKQLSGVLRDCDVRCCCCAGLDLPDTVLRDKWLQLTGLAKQIPSEPQDSILLFGLHVKSQ